MSQYPSRHIIVISSKPLQQCQKIFYFLCSRNPLTHLIISKVNPHQITLITANQPVYTLGKQIMWQYTEECKDVFSMMGPLNIEMAFMNVIGNWLVGSSWVEVFEKGKEFTLATLESFLHGNKVKHCCCGHQVSLAAFWKLAGDAFMIETKGQEKYITYAEWVTKKVSLQ